MDDQTNDTAREPVAGPSGAAADRTGAVAAAPPSTTAAGWALGSRADDLDRASARSRV